VRDLEEGAIAALVSRVDDAALEGPSRQEGLIVFTHQNLLTTLRPRRKHCWLSMAIR